MKPSSFYKYYPWSSVFGQAEYEIVAKNIMTILAIRCKRKKDTFHQISWTFYERVRRQDGNFSKQEKFFFDKVIPYFESHENAITFSPTWKEIADMIQFIENELMLLPYNRGYLIENVAFEFNVNEIVDFISKHHIEIISKEEIEECHSIDESIKAGDTVLVEPDGIVLPVSVVEERIAEIANSWKQGTRIVGDSDVRQYVTYIYLLTHN